MGTGAEVAVGAEAAGAAKGAAEVGAAVAGDAFLPGALVSGSAAAPIIGDAFLPAALAASEGLATVGTAGAGAFAAPVASGITLSGVLDTAKTVATIASPAASIMQAASGEQALRRVGGVTNATASPPVAPVVTPMVQMPTQSSEGPVIGTPTTIGAINSLRANIQEQLVRRGRYATILTSPSGSGSKLGN